MSEDTREPTTKEEQEFGTDVERVGSGYAPLIDPGNPKSRDQREAEAYEALDGKMLKDPHISKIPTDAEVAASVDRSRSAPFGDPIEKRTVIVNGVAMVVGAGPKAEETGMPDVAMEVLEQSAEPRRTAQMRGLGNGLRTFDLTDERTKAGDAMAAIKAGREAKAEQIEAEQSASREAEGEQIEVEQSASREAAPPSARASTPPPRPAPR